MQADVIVLLACGVVAAVVTYRAVMRNHLRRPGDRNDGPPPLWGVILASLVFSMFVLIALWTRPAR